MADPVFEMEGGPTETPHARAIVDAIVAGRLVKVECPAHPEASCLVVWTETAYEQIDAYVRDQVQRHAREARNLLALLTTTYNDLRGAVGSLRDLPPDTVLGGNGAAALDEIAAATDGLGGVLANYPDRDAAVGDYETEGECRRRWARKVLAHKREIAELRRLLNNLLAAADSPDPNGMWSTAEAEARTLLDGGSDA